MLGYHTISEAPISDVIEPIITMIDRLVPIHSFRVITDRIGQNVALGTGIFEVAVNMPLNEVLALAGVTVWNSRLSNTPAVILSNVGAATASGNFSQISTGTLTGYGNSFAASAFNSVASALFTCQGSSV